MMSEAKLEGLLTAAALAQGGDAIKMRWPGFPGAPDRLVLLPGTNAPLFVEVKAPAVGPKLQPHQEAVRDLLLHCGCQYALLHDPEQIEHFLRMMRR